MLRYLFLLFSCLSFSASAQHPPVFEGMKIDTTHINLGGLRINMVRYAYGKPNIDFLVIHDSEDTGLRAAFEYIQFSGGRVIDSQYGNQRNFQFNYKGVHFQTDPNSIYSDQGRQIGIEKYRTKYDEGVLDQLANTSKVILDLYNPKKLGYIFTLHNNANGGFDISSYLKGHTLDEVSDSVHINFAMDPDDLILVTEKELFNRLKKADVNTILQHIDTDDDGSLSVYAKLNNIPYINVEVQHGHQEQNLELIEIAIKALYDAYPHLKPKAAN